MTEEHEEFATLNGEPIVLDDGQMEALTDEELNFGEPEIVTLTISRTKVDPTVQRRLDNARVNGMIAKYNPTGLGIITINEREDGGLYVVDGQHRRALLMRSDREDTVVTVNKYKGLSRAQEAYLFVMLNTTKKPTPVDLFRARLVARHAPTHHMYQILTKAGWTITLQPGNGRFGAVKSLETLYYLDAVAAERTVKILTEAFGRANGSMDFRILNGLGRVLVRYGDLIKDERMIKKLGDSPGKFAGLLSAANTFKNTMRQRASDAMAFVIVTEYNRGARADNSLEAWGTTVG